MPTYTGALQDAVSPGTGFLYLGNRWYSPPVEPNAGVGNQVGPAHFTQPDSTTQLDNPANGNLYGYAADSPVNYVDPTGQCVLGVFGSNCGATQSCVFSAAVLAAGILVSALGIGASIAAPIFSPRAYNIEVAGLAVGVAGALQLDSACPGGG